MPHSSDMAADTKHTRPADPKPSDLPSNLRRLVLARVEADPGTVWTPSDFADLASRAAVDKVLQRLATSGELRRIDRGLYDRPRPNRLTGKPAVPDYRAVIQAVARRDKARVLVDGLTAANDLGLTNAVPGRIHVLADARIKPIRLGAQEIHFQHAAPSRLYWASRPAMRVVQALHWLQDTLADPDERARIAARLRSVLRDLTHGQAIRDDLRAGFSALPIWMQEFLRELLAEEQVARETNEGGSENTSDRASEDDTSDDARDDTSERHRGHGIE